MFHGNNMDKYEFLDHLGEGKFGNVFKAQHKRNGNYVAVKQNTSSFNMLRRESTILNYLHQKSVKNVPPVIYYGKDEDLFYLIIPFYSYDLYDYIEKKKPSLEHIKIIMGKCIDVLHHIHYHDIVHCDVKPQNFMIHEGNVILIDFGLSTYVSTGDKEREHIIGTPRFISYFIHDGKSYTYRDDLISLGYIYLLFVKRKLPWDDIENVNNTHVLHPNNLDRKLLKRIERIAEFEPTLCKFFDYLYSVEGFPDYDKLHSLL